MGKLVRVLVILSTPLAVGALVFGIFLFDKREILVGRTGMLETSIINISRYIEEEDAEELKVEHTGKDSSDVEARSVTNPDIDPFWETYNDALETSDIPHFSWNNNATKKALREFYKLDPDGKPVRDLNNKKDRNGRMKTLLSTLESRVAKQSSNLSSTRAQMVTLRKELENTIDQLNSQKSQRRSNLITIKDQEETIAQLESKVAAQKRQISDLEQQKRELNEEITTLNAEINGLKDELLGLNKRIAELDTIIKQQRGIIEGYERNRTGGPSGTDVGPGPKGKIVSINTEHNYVMVQLNADFIAEIQAKPDTAGALIVELYVRPDAENSRVTNKIRIERFDLKTKVGVGTILTDWQQAPFNIGDIVFN